MFGEITFELFEESDAAQVAELLNRNRFHTARNKHMTAEEYLFTQHSRGVCFSVVAKKKGKVIGLAGAYPTSDQAVAKKHQVFVGTFLVDMQYRLSYSIIMGLYDGLMKGLTQSDYKEILSGVRPQNEASYHLMLKCGFVLLDATPNDFGRIGLHNFSPAFSKYAGAASMEMNSNMFFSGLPVVDKKEARKLQAKPLLNDRYIEIDYKLNGQDVTLLFDIVNYKIDGALVPEYLKFYPSFDTKGRYVLENLDASETINTKIQLVMEAGSEEENITHEISLLPGQTQIIDCAQAVCEMKIFYMDAWYCFYPNLFEEVTLPKAPISFGSGKLSAVLMPSTGFISIMEGEKKLATLLWPCATMPYIEGIFVPRMKDLNVEQKDDSIVITEETDAYVLVRTCVLSSDKMDITTTLQCKTKDLNLRPISQIYAEKGVQGYALTSGENIREYGANAIRHEGYEYSDYTYWETDPEEFADFPIECISLHYPSSVVDILIDEKCKPVIHAPVFTSTLDVNMDNILDTQTIEKMQIQYKREETSC